ncbi:MAG: 3-phosphoshikimate 1-carboxyvinyltransferase [Clostridiales bacterium]|jgi:3-phosphoshikimate 1-carboxyvinyltransferase|nr:3-phosphoshikimate 1-carboxyvinyltransferase [Clostridiales bacterium]
MLKVERVHTLKGTIEVPGDKSISHRGVMFGGISRGKTHIKGFLAGEDCLSTIRCFRGLGVEIRQEGDEVEVIGRGTNGLTEPTDVLNAGNSGTTMRLMSGILAGQSFLSIITGDQSLRSRPMARVADPLRLMGAKIDGRNGGKLAPLVIRGGNLKGMVYQSPVASAQVKSAILLSGLYADGITTVVEKEKTRDHTEKMLRAFGGNVSVSGLQVSVSASKLEGQSIQVPGDISSAAFFMVAAAAMPGAELKIKNVGLNPTRTGIIDVLEAMGATIEIEDRFESGGEPMGTIVIKGGVLHGTEISGEMIPRLVDEIPVIAVAAALAEGKTRITGAEELKFKESNRIDAMVSALGTVGANIKALPDGMEIVGPSKIQGGAIDSLGDHRIAMAMAVCGLFSEQAIEIEDSACIDISFPQFETLLKRICR